MYIKRIIKIKENLMKKSTTVYLTDFTECKVFIDTLRSVDGFVVVCVVL